MTIENMHAAHSTAEHPAEIAAELTRGITEPPVAITFFFSPKRDGSAIAAHLRKAFPKTQILACSTCGELSTGRLTQGATSAAFLHRSHAKRAAVALARFEGGVERGIKTAVAELERSLGQPLSTLDPKNHVGVIVIDSVHGTEEEAHLVLGNVAPSLSFVGGSAGDDLKFENTHVLAGDQLTNHGCALMVLETSKPYEIVKLCHFESSGKKAVVTRGDKRRLIELDGRPAADVYAAMLGVTKEKLAFELVAMNPAGLVIDGEAWVRQCISKVREGDSMLLGCELPVGSTLHFLKQKAHIVEHFSAEMGKVKQRLGGLGGVLMFDCGLRAMELHIIGAMDAYAKEINFPAAGMNTHGESWLGHMHQTLTALAFG